MAVPMEKTRRVSQACDACKLRKVKCNGESRCQQCSHLDLRCIYSTAKTQRRAAQKRGRLISQYKESTAGNRSILSPLKPALPAVEEASSSQSPTAIPVTSPYDARFFSDLLPDYQSSVFPVNPIITEAEVKESLAKMSTEKEHLAFLHAFAAVTINLTRTGPAHLSDISRQIVSLISKAIEIRGLPLPDERVTIRRIMVSMFAHNCFMTLQNFEMAFYYLREAITMIQMLRVENQEIMSVLDIRERARRQRLYWEAFVHERFLSIVEYRTAILSPLPQLPERDPTLAPGVHDGFVQIINLFKLVDGDFLSNWLGSYNNPNVTSTWIESKHKQLDDEDTIGSPEVAHLTDMQQADLIITRQWLRSLVWQMAMSRCLLSSGASKQCMSLLFPVTLSQQLRLLISHMSRTAIDVHGSGILKKLFELTDTIADVIIHVPAGTLDETTARVDDFLFLLRFLFTFPRFDLVQKQLLQKKLETLQLLFPYIQETEVDIPAAAIQHIEHQDPWLDIARSMLPHRPEESVYAPDTPLEGNFSDSDTTPNGQFLAPPNDPELRWQTVTRRLSLANLTSA